MPPETKLWRAMSKRRRPDVQLDMADTSRLLDTMPSDQHKEECTDIRGDRANIAILFFLYLLQGIPIGLTAAIPMLLQNRGASYKEQAEFR